ncbi:MAG: hypothetical protein RLZ59_1092 [Pseudomonadota bacterium]
MNKALLCIGLSLVAAGPAMAQTIERREVRIMPAPMSRVDLEAKLKAQFAEQDANKDGFVTREEVAAQREARVKAAMGRMFDAMDGNKDGSISRAEFDAHHASMRMDMPPMPGGPDAPAVLMMHGGDGRQVETIMIPRSGADGAKVPAPSIAGGPRVIVQTRVMGGPLGGMITERSFATADANTDAKLTEAEVSAAALAQFDRLDTNKDGVLSAAERGAEAKAMRKMWRKGKARS